MDKKMEEILNRFSQCKDMEEVRSLIGDLREDSLAMQKAYMEEEARSVVMKNIAPKRKDDTILYCVDDNELEYEKDHNGEYWLYRGKYHRTEGPALIFSNGTKYWYNNGLLHRVDGPAIELANGDKYWYKDGKLHRLDGPAYEGANGVKEWYLYGEYYSEQEYKNKMKERQRVRDEQNIW